MIAKFNHKQSKLIPAVVAILLFILAVSYFITKTQQTSTAVRGTFHEHLKIDPKPQNNEPAILNSIKVVTVGESPEIHGLKNKVVEQHLNEKLKTVLKDINGSISEIDQLNNSYVVLELGVYRYEGFYPTRQIVTFNYSISEDKELKLEDIFKPNFSYLEALSWTCFRKLEAAGSTPTRTKPMYGLEPSKENFAKKVVFLPNALTVIFEDDDVIPHAGGQKRVVIPYNDPIVPYKPITEHPNL